MKLKSIIKTVLLTSTLMLSMQTWAIPLGSIKHLYVFGDSLSDEGVQNNNPIVLAIPGKNPVWSIPNDAHTWPYYLAQKLEVSDPGPNNKAFIPTATSKNDYVSGNLNGTNYAAGGATTNSDSYNSNPDYDAPSILMQVNYYLQQSNGKADPQGLYILWAGANDLFETLYDDISSGKSQAEIGADILASEKSAVANLKTAAIQLHNAGAKTIMVINLPDLGKVPEFIALGEQAAQALTMASTNFSIDINSEFVDLSFRIIGFDTFNMLNKVIHDATTSHQYTDHLGVTYTIDDVRNEADPCAQIQNPQENNKALYCDVSNTDTASTQHLFADLVHPSDMTHRIIADEIYYALKIA
jgi:outer membrane lipase/esterase